MNTDTEDKLQRAKEQALSQYSSIVEMVRALYEDSYRKDFISKMTPEAKRAYLLDNDYTEEEYELRLADGDVDDIVAELIESGPEPDDYCFDEDDARQTIQEDALDVSVRSGWQNVGEPLTPSEFTILLATGGPAVRIRGELDRFNEPCRAWLECSDWFQAWVEVFNERISQQVLLRYCAQFYFGEA